MDKLVEELLSIERAGKDSLAGLEKEQAVNAKQTEAEIARILQEIKQKTDMAVEALKRDADAALKAELVDIESEYMQKAAQLQELFDANGAKWREELAAHVLS